jgi:hypothetical protein
MLLEQPAIVVAELEEAPWAPFNPSAVAPLSVVRGLGEGLAGRLVPVA